MERRAYRIAEYGCGNAADALDIVQDAMLRLVDRYRARPPAEWAPLFYRILEHRLQDHHRRGSVRRRVFGALGFDDEEGSDPLERVPGPADAQPEVRLSDAEQRAVLREAIKGLPLRQQQAVLLRDWEGLDVRGTAFAMGCSEGSVKTHYSRAIAHLRAALAGKEL